MDDCQPIAQSGRRQLRSGDTNVLAVRRTYTRLGDRSLPVAGPENEQFARVIATVGH